MTRETGEWGTGVSLYEQMHRECIEMAKYASASGMTIPVNLARALEKVEQEPDASERGGEDETPASPTAPALSFSRLAGIHGQLAEIIAPARPGTVALFARESVTRGFWNFFGPIPLVRRMLFTAVLSLLSLVAVSLSKEVDGTVEKFSLAQNSGLSLLLNFLFLFSAAAIGASFAALYRVHAFIRDRTFDPGLESSYWIRFLMGLLAGTVLAFLFPLEAYLAKSSAMSASQNALHGLAKPTLAMLGGFSAELVYRLLNKLISTLGSLVESDRGEQLKNERQKLQAQAQSKLNQTHLNLANNLVKLKQKLTSDMTAEQMQGEVDRLLADLAPNTGGGEG